MQERYVFTRENEVEVVFYDRATRRYIILPRGSELQQEDMIGNEMDDKVM